MDERGVYHILRRNFSLPRFRKCPSENCRQRNQFMDARGKSQFPVAVFLHHSFENFPREPFFVPRKFWQRNHFMDARGITRFSVEFFCLTLPKAFIRNSSVLQKISGCEKCVWIREGDITFFRRIFFESQYPKVLIGNSSVLQKFSCSGKFVWMREGDVTFSVKIFLHDGFKIFLWELFVAPENFWQRNQIMDARWITGFSFEISLSHCSESFIGNFLLFQKVSGRENFLWKRVGSGDITFPRRFLLSHITKKFHRELFDVSINFW